MADAKAQYFDGATARPRAVDLAFEPHGVAVLEAGAVVARWRYDAIRRLDVPSGLLRVRSLEAPELARLDVADPEAAKRLEAACKRLDEASGRDPRLVLRIVGWSLAAGLSLILTVAYLVPVAADLLAPLVPPAMERRLGDAVDNQVRALFGKDTCDAEPGRAALANLSDRLSGQLDLPVPAVVAVLRSDIPNAIALPGGRIYLFDGLLQRAGEPDEVAGVLAHEIGHVKARDGLRRLIQTGGSSFLLGLLFGDVTGSGAIILAARILVDSAYSRGAETAADRTAAEIMLGLNRSPKPMGSFLVRLTGKGGHPLPFLASHPVSEERLAALSRREAPVLGPPLLTDEEWRALRSICRKS